jgi:hypothetical protein
MAGVAQGGRQQVQPGQVGGVAAQAVFVVRAAIDIVEDEAGQPPACMPAVVVRIELNARLSRRAGLSALP